MKIQFSEAWGGWQAQAVVNGELRTIINRSSRTSAINRLIEIICTEAESKMN